MIKGTFKGYLDEQMKNPDFKKAWHGLDSEFELLESMIKVREKSGITQAQLAKKIGTKQSVISRLERGGFSKATVETLNKIANALDAKLVIKIQKKAKAA
mgnify:FL=1